VISDFPANRSIPSFSYKSAKATETSFIGKSAGITQIGLCHQIGQNRRFPVLAQIARSHRIADSRKSHSPSAIGDLPASPSIPR